MGCFSENSIHNSGKSRSFKYHLYQEETTKKLSTSTRFRYSKTTKKNKKSIWTTNRTSEPHWLKLVPLDGIFWLFPPSDLQVFFLYNCRKFINEKSGTVATYIYIYIFSYYFSAGREGNGSRDLPLIVGELLGGHGGTSRPSWKLWRLSHNQNIVWWLFGQLFHRLSSSVCIHHSSSDSQACLCGHEFPWKLSSLLSACSASLRYSSLPIKRTVNRAVAQTDEKRWRERREQSVKNLAKGVGQELPEAHVDSLSREGLWAAKECRERAWRTPAWTLPTWSPIRFQQFASEMKEVPSAFYK